MVLTFQALCIVTGIAFTHRPTVPMAVSWVLVTLWLIKEERELEQRNIEQQLDLAPRPVQFNEDDPDW